MHDRTNGNPIRQPAESAPAVWIVLGCIWLLIGLTFSPPGRSDDVNLGLFDGVAMAKAAGRAAVMVLLGVVFLRHWNHARRASLLRICLPWFAFALWALVSVSWSALPKVSLAQAGSFCVLLLLACNVGLACGDPTAFERWVKRLCQTLLVVVAGLLAAYVVLPDLGSLTRDGKGLMHATNSSATAALGLVLLVAGRVVYRWQWSQRLLWPGVAVFGTALLLAQSRTALGVTLLVVGGLLALYVSGAWRAAALTAAAAALAVYLAWDPGLEAVDTILAAVATYTFRGQSADELAQLSGREEMWTVMWASFREAPWLGHGYFCSSASGEIYVWYEWTNWTAHNLWLQTLVSTGLVGGLLLATGYLSLAYRLVSAVRRARLERRFAVFLGAVAAWQLGWGINNESIVGPLQPESVVFFVLLGAAAGRLAAVQGQLARSTHAVDRFPVSRSTAPAPAL